MTSNLNMLSVLEKELKINEWSKKKYFWFFTIYQILIIAHLILHLSGINLGPTQYCLGFAYALFFPGFLILRLLKIKSPYCGETVLYAIGLSIFFLLALGFIINWLYPLFGINNPLSFISVILSVVSITSLLYLTERILEKIPNVQINKINSQILSKSTTPDKWDNILVLVLILLVLLSIAGAELVKTSLNNSILLLMIALIPFIIIIFVFYGRISSRIYPIAVFCISLALLLHSSLISDFVIGNDVMLELYLAKYTNLHAIWNSINPVNPYNATLSITILPVIFNKLSMIEPNWLFKICYPFIFSFAPLGLYYAYKNLISDKLAFLSVFFFMSMPVFFFQILNLTRQLIGELFLALFLCTILSSTLNQQKKTILVLVSVFSLTVSHYSLSYLFAFIVFTSWLLSQLFSKWGPSPLKKIFTGLINHDNTSSKYNMITFGFTIFVLVITLSWYLYTSNSVTFVSIVNLINTMSSNFATDFFYALSRDYRILQLFGIEKVPVFLDQIRNIFYLITQFFVIFGLFSIIFDRAYKNINRLYVAFIFPCIFIILCCIIIPFFARSMNMIRIYHITLFFLSPLALIGGQRFIRLIHENIINRKHFNINKYEYIRWITIVILIPYFILNTGFLNEVLGSTPASLSLGLKRMLESKTADFTRGGYGVYLHEPEVEGALWLSNHINNKDKIETDVTNIVGNGPLVAYAMIPYTAISRLNKADKKVDKNTLIYLGYINVIEERFREENKLTTLMTSVNQAEYIHLFINKNLIYSNGSCQIYK